MKGETTTKLRDSPVLPALTKPLQPPLIYNFYVFIFLINYPIYDYFLLFYLTTITLSLNGAFNGLSFQPPESDYKKQLSSLQVVVSITSRVFSFCLWVLA